MTDKPAATECPQCGGEKNNPCFLWTQTTGWGDVECGPKCANIFHNAPTPPANQPTVTLARAVELLEHGILAMTGRARVAWADKVRDFLALLRAAEQE